MFCVVVPGHELNEPLTGTSSVGVTSTAPVTNSATTAVFPSTSSESNSPASPAVCSTNQEITVPVSAASIPLAAGNLISARPGSMVRVPEIANGRKS